MNLYYEVIVLGGGHAGIEASNICSKLFRKTLLITKSIDEMGKLSCNPSIGGTGKSHLVKEIDILGGLMAKVSDFSCTYINILNKSKGYSVKSTRMQVDKYFYKLNINREISKNSYLDIYQSNVYDLLVLNGSIDGVILDSGVVIKCKFLILTSGTFINSKISFGNNLFNGFRDNELYFNNNIFQTLKKHIPFYGCFKTGTPPRVDLRFINFSKLKPCYSNVSKFSYFSLTNNKKFKNKIFKCWTTKTSLLTKNIVIKNINGSSLYSGIINSLGPRYCPSLEDKYFRYPKNNFHNIFIEIESAFTNEAYINGISNAFCFRIQNKILNSIKGLEKSSLIKNSYSIEYSFFNPINLYRNLESKYIKNLFFAGQVNGTTGYEEAASQGLYAGINVCNKSSFNNNFFLSEKSSYIGVMVNDLTKNGVDEPYRMFSSRSKNRIYLREDNVIDRLLYKSFKNNLIGYTKFFFLVNIKKCLRILIKKIKANFIFFNNNNVSLFSLIRSNKFSSKYFYKKNIIKKCKYYYFIKKFFKFNFFDYLDAKIIYSFHFIRNKKEMDFIESSKDNFKISYRTLNRIKSVPKFLINKIKNYGIRNIKDLKNIPLIKPSEIYNIKTFLLNYLF